MQDATNPGQTADIDEIYRQLKRGLGHQHVNDDNVFELIDRAERDGQQVLAQELREWQSPCRPDSSGMPSTMAPRIVSWAADDISAGSSNGSGSRPSDATLMAPAR